jgi:hypothetical protein
VSDVIALLVFVSFVAFVIYRLTRDEPAAEPQFEIIRLYRGIHRIPQPYQDDIRRACHPKYGNILMLSDVPARAGPYLLAAYAAIATGQGSAEASGSEGHTLQSGWQPDSDGSRTFYAADSAIGTLSADGSTYSVTTGTGYAETTTTYTATSAGDYGNVYYVSESGETVNVPSDNCFL